MKSMERLEQFLRAMRGLGVYLPEGLDPWSDVDKFLDIVETAVRNHERFQDQDDLPEEFEHPVPAVAVAMSLDGRRRRPVTDKEAEAVVREWNKALGRK